MTDQLQKIKADLIAELDKRIADQIIEQTNADLLKKLITNAETINEAIMIAELGTTYKRTGFHFDKRLEKMTDTIKYFKKNEKLSFVQDPNALTHKLIIGDNYDALLNLLIQYRGKIDVIYIDPPYGKDAMGEFAKTNYNNAITRDNLLSMLYPRLVLARQLLCDNGVIFCSIDDKNQAYVKGLFDEVFGEANFITSFSYEKTQHFGRQKVNFYSNVDYVLCYANRLYNSSGNKKELLIEYEKTDFEDAPLYNASNPENVLRFPAGSVKFNIKDGVYKETTDNKYKLLSEVIVENGKNKNDFKLKFHSRWSADKVLEEFKKGTTYWVKSVNFAIRAIYADGKIFYESPKQMIFTNAKNEFVAKINEKIKVGTNEDGSSELEEIIGDKLFGYPKPTTLVEYLVNLIKLDNAIILDFFAGSGTTGQAVLELNKQDGGKRQFILVNANEITDTTPNGIVYDVTSKRLKRVMTGECYDGTRNFKWNEKNEPLGDNLDVYDIATVANFEATEGNTPFEVIDETLYGKEKLGVQEKIQWVCEHFEHTQKKLSEE
jgi:adenine-specific DNA-methyltransferase